MVVVTDYKESDPGHGTSLKLFDSFRMKRRHGSARVKLSVKPVHAELGESDPFSPTDKQQIITILDQHGVFVTI